eukprot:1095660-Pyramimonas_sp.AAC.1
MQIWSLASLVTKGDSHDAKLLVALCPITMFPSAKLRSRTRALIARFCAWCGGQLRKGKYPTRGFHGGELPSCSWRAK